MVRYIGRYIRHSAIAESRIESYDGERVTFFYFDDDENKHQVTMDVEEFITAVIGHIPDPQFKTIRHYGIYARGKRRFFRKLLGVVSMVQRRLTGQRWSWAPECPKCGVKMEFVCSSGMLDRLDRPPPEFELVKGPMFGERIIDWGYITSSSISR